MANTDVPRQSVIEVRAISKRFGRTAVLNEISYSVYRGETLVILGRSGSGKSVTLKTMIGLLEPDAGRVDILGQNIHQLNENQRLAFRKKIGYVFQGAALFDSLTVLENVGFSLYEEGELNDIEIRKQVEDRLRMVGLAHTIDAYPGELSGGMQKRIGLARALIKLPELIFYDEPTSGLDPLTTDVINQIILRLRNKLHVTSVVVTHDMRSAFTIADRIIMLDQGRIVFEGTPQEIQLSPNPWVQHFIAGNALDSERIDSGQFGAVKDKTSQRIARSGSGLHPAIQGDERARTSGLLPAIRNRRKTSGVQPAIDIDSDDANPTIDTDQRQKD